MEKPQWLSSWLALLPAGKNRFFNEDGSVRKNLSAEEQALYVALVCLERAEKAERDLVALKDRDYEPVKRWITEHAPEAVQHAYKLMIEAELQVENLESVNDAQRRDIDDLIKVMPPCHVCGALIGMEHQGFCSVSPGVYDAKQAAFMLDGLRKAAKDNWERAEREAKRAEKAEAERDAKEIARTEFHQGLLRALEKQAEYCDRYKAAVSERDTALERAEKAEANYQFMVNKAADEKLDGYRELGARAAQAENDRDDARKAAKYEADVAAQALADLTAARKERDEALKDLTEKKEYEAGYGAGVNSCLPEINTLHERVQVVTLALTAQTKRMGDYACVPRWPKERDPRKGGLTREEYIAQKGTDEGWQPQILDEWLDSPSSKRRGEKQWHEFLCPEGRAALGLPE